MKSPQTSNINTKAGFTLIEMVIVISLIAVIGGFGLFFGIDSLRGYSFHSDRDTLVSTLQHARAEAMANICRGTDCADGGKPQGVYIDTSARKFIVFQGTTYDPHDDNNAPVDYSQNTILPDDGSLRTIVFDQLSGNVDAPGYITINDATNVHSSKVEISDQGQILWSN
ncbi:MAG TPA: prepilin-type N-terminal cleavage/methylation domain-containing protein [Candidatus Paceibacterota bacterium]|nr:prepilin-type N-terminal cleavage/methylation domain-containing protein [Candidatus Paceibacterota bacterium]